jgi:hypothetical protein
LQPQPSQRHAESVATYLGEVDVEGGDICPGTACQAHTPKASAATPRGANGFMDMHSNALVHDIAPRWRTGSQRRARMKLCERRNAWRYLLASQPWRALAYASSRRRIASALSNSRRACSTPCCSGHFRPQPKSSHTQPEYGLLLSGLPSAWAAVASISRARAMVTSFIFLSVSCEDYSSWGSEAQ